jgi:protein phosphatase
MKINISATTDVGHNRDNNEDAYAFCPDLTESDWRRNHTDGYITLGSQGSLLIVADGMGGTNAGEVASAIAIDTVSKAFTPQAAKEADNDERRQALLTRAIRDADKAINRHMVDHPETAGMGTTIVVCWIYGDKAYTAWCGDSRCYLYNDKGLKPLTKDHSYVQELIDKGVITEEEAFTHPDNNVITRGLGDFDSPCIPDLNITDIHAGDTVLLCSDGLCGYCTDDMIAKALADSSDTDVDTCADNLQQLALNVPGDDNICIVLASLLDDDDPRAVTVGPLRRFLHRLFGKD